MRNLEIIRNRKRYQMFSEKTKFKVLELNSFFSKYTMRYEDKIKKIFTYYDTPNQDLQKSNIVLFKTQIGKFTELNMKTEKVSNNFRYMVRENFKHFSKPIKPTDSLFKHKEFLIDNFKTMFVSSLNFDPEFFMQKLQVAYIIKTTSTEYRRMNATGLKITYSFDDDLYTNEQNKNIVKNNVLTIYQHSPQITDPDYEDLLGKLERYCKELTPTSETKIMIARRLTATKVEDIKKNDYLEDKRKNDKKNAKKKNKK